MLRFRDATLVAALTFGLLSATAIAGEAPRPRHAAKLVVVNDDGFSAFFSERYRNADDLRRQVGSFGDTQVAVLEWCIASGSRVNFPAKGYELIGAGVTEFPRRGDKIVAALLQQFADEGTDTLAVVAAACRETGIACYASLRMNGDYNAEWMGETLPRMFNSTFWWSHPEYRVRGKAGEDRTKLSYAFPEVREYKLGILRAAAERDIDGINLDFLRHPDFLGYEQPLIDVFQSRHGIDPRTLPATDARWMKLRAEIMTGFVRDVRALLDAAGKKNGRRLGLSARVDWKAHRAWGCDVEAWMKEGLLDYAVFAQRSLGGYEFDLKPFVAMARGTGCAVLFGEEAILTGNDLTAQEDKLVAAGKMKAPERATLTLARYQERAARWYAAGADGVHLFNENRREVFRMVGDVPPAR
ncbi:MAG TPA: family 10 glycosylhydrolase [Opitutaceae bacterium]|nr:family 10 glycosylhydrolase [Opitutaceae bacterium]